MRTPSSIAARIGLGLVLASVGCASYAGPGPGANLGDAAPQNEGDAGADAGALPECTAQRAVHLMAGNGGLAWFTLVWPVPPMIENFEARFAYDNVFFANSDASLPPDHPLFTRRVAQRTLWQNLGKRPSATVMVAGTNQTHTSTPNQRTFANGNDTFSLAGALQTGLRAPLPTLSLGRSGLVARGPVPGVVAASVEFAIALLKTSSGITTEQEAQLRPTPAAIDEWTQKSTYAPFRTLAEYLYFTAAAFRLGLVATVVAPALEDDPHGAFTDKVLLTKRADELTHTLDSFYEALNKAVEPACTRRRVPVSLADNVVLVITGDTPKNSFAQQGWGDATPQNTNWIFARTNGFLRPGWFGEIKETTGQGFDAHTGALAATSNKDAALAGILYAIARGDAAAVSAVGATVDYAGLVDPVGP